MSARPDDGDQPAAEQPPLRRVLMSATTGLLTTVVERFWQDRGYRTARKDRGEHRFVLVRESDGTRTAVVWVDPGATATPAHVERLSRMASSFGATEATLTSGRDYGDDIYLAADEHGVECLAHEQLVTLVDRAGLRGVIREYVATTQTVSEASSTGSEASSSAVADGGAEGTRRFELQPAADHPLPVRGGLVVGGAVLSLLAVWGGAAEVTTQLQSCSGGCLPLWLVSFLPMLVMLAGSFAVVVGLFD